MNRSLGIKHLIRGLAIPAVIALSGCGGESSNIEPEGGSSFVCDGLGVTCVTGRFIDDAVANVDYECELPGVRTVKSVTGGDGTFSCPNGSVATFSLINPEKPEYRIELGSVTVTSTARLNGDNPAATPVYFYVTPLHLDGVNDDEQFEEADLSPAALNITRLLQTMHDSDVPGCDMVDIHLPNRRICISAEDKKKIVPENLELSLEFNQPSNSFDESVADYLAAIGKGPSLISEEDAKKLLQKGIYSTVAGLYDVGKAAPLSTGGVLDTRVGLMTGKGSNDGHFVGAFWNVVDRRGRMIGAGVYSYQGEAEDFSVTPWTISSDPKPFELASSGITHAATGVPIWPNNGDLSKMTYNLLDASRAPTGSQAKLMTGKMRREAVVGSPIQYQTLFEESVASSSSTELGQWALQGGSLPSIAQTSGRFTLMHSVPVATWMNPDAWAGVDFPLPITVSFYNFDTACGGNGCEIGELRMVILEDGNIVSDMHGKCGVGINFDTLNYGPPAEQEIPLGVVANIIPGLRDDGGDSMTAMTLLAMLPNHSGLISGISAVAANQEYLRYSQFGNNVYGFPLLRVSGELGMYGGCAESESGDINCVSGAAIWSNPLTAIKWYKATTAETPDPDEVANLEKNAGGHMEAVRTVDCDGI